MAQYLHNKHFKVHRPDIDRISRMPFCEEVINPYYISPSIRSLETDLEKMLLLVLNSHSDCADGQNSNMLDDYIRSWEELVKASLESQSEEHKNKLSALTRSFFSIQRNAKDWIEYEEKTCADIRRQLQDAIEEQKRYSKIF